MRSHLLILGDREGIAWVVSKERMAFTASRARNASRAIEVGDELFLYATRGAFGNPTRDRGRAFGRAVASSPVKRFARPFRLGTRTLTHGCALELDLLAPPRQGVELAELVPQLSTFPNKVGWAATLRTPLRTMTPEDAKLLRRHLRAEAQPAAEQVAAYRAEASQSD